MGNDMTHDDIDENDPDNGVLRDPEFDSGSLLGDGENGDFDPEPTDEKLDDIDADADEDEWADKDDSFDEFDFDENDDFTEDDGDDDEN